MYYFMIIARPATPAVQSGETGGAYVSCWINFSIKDGAELLARHYIQEAGWVPEETEDSKWVERDSYRGNPGNMKYCLEAEADGASFVFHEWPVDAPDADMDPSTASS